ncbi:hypothetical protein LCGC14_1185770 [marine sediment metagenome]|uniref:HTH cro/C1-type domain-containing protein n=1 Tax=marine sediment metagenome TaxID=412755 RepID=A0A0F9LKS0_9ZZZZ
MLNPNKGASTDVLVRLKAASYERFRIELFNSVEKLLEDFDMTWQDLARKLGWSISGDGAWLKRKIGNEELDLQELNEIAHVFSSEPYLIFRPRFPWTQT